MQIMRETTETLTGLRVEKYDDIGLSYATTLKMWHETWCEQEEAIKSIGYDDVFFRKWRFYFSYCEGAFATQLLHVYQISFVKSEAGGTAPKAVDTLAADTNAQLLYSCLGLVYSLAMAILFLLSQSPQVRLRKPVSGALFSPSES